MYFLKNITIKNGGIMKLNEEAKQIILHYILDKISSEAEDLSKSVCEAFNISVNTFHKYINELIDAGTIEKVKRGKYRLITQTYERTFRRSLGELISDTLPYEECLEKHIAMFPKNVQHIWAYAISEMVNNVMDHSEAEEMKMTVKIDHLKTTVIIEDNGVGIFEKIKKHFDLPSLDEAICELFKGKLTTDASNHSGEGIFFTSKMMDDFYIISNRKIFTTSKYEISQILNEGNNVSGTLIYMSLSNFTKKTAKDIFDTYADVDNGFTKTRIPMKNIFDSAPVSRSQAKRICNRLEQFEEVVLDFDEIEWMGQGFAHQIFVVFKKNNTKTRLLVENMSENVKKMYDHVIYTN